MATATVDAAQKRTVVEVDTAEVTPFPGLNPRHRFDETEMAELQDSIEEEGGNLIPALITDPPEGHPVDTPYGLVYGERRWRASSSAGTKLLAIYQPGLTWARIVKLAGIENLKRVDLSAIEKAHWYQLMMDEGETTQEEIADLEGVDQSTISNTLRLLELPQEIVDLVDDGKLAPTNARDLLLPWMKEEKAIREKFFRIVAQQLDFGATTGQHMSKPWLKEMVERVGKIAKPPAAPKPAPAAKPAAKKDTPAKKEPAPEAEPGEAPGNAEPEEKPPAEATAAPTTPDPAPVDEPVDENVERQKAAAAPHQSVEVDFEVGVVGVAAQTLGDAIHHLTLTLQRHPSDAGQFFVTVLPKSQKGMPSGTGEQASGTVQTIDDQLREALERFVAKLNREEK